MGASDTVTKAYMSEAAVFADAFNFFLYGGRPVIDPTQLVPVDTTELAIPHQADGKGEAVQKYRDILQSVNIMEDGKVTYLLLGIENQTEIHYAMPVRNMVYDALQYAKQVDTIARQHRRNKEYAGHNHAEYLSGFFREDRVVPVITLVVLFSPNAWDAPRSLHEMMGDIPPEVLSMVQDYKLHLIEPASLTPESLKQFRSSLREVMGFIKYSQEKEKLKELVETDSQFRSLDRSAATVISTCTNAELQIDEHSEVTNVCKAIQDMRQDSLEKGIAQGIEKGIKEGIEKGIEKGIERGVAQGLEKGIVQGQTLGRMEQAQKTALNLASLGFSIEQIAKIVECDPKTVLQWLSTQNGQNNA